MSQEAPGQEEAAFQEEASAIVKRGGENELPVSRGKQGPALPSLPPHLLFPMLTADHGDLNGPVCHLEPPAVPHAQHGWWRTQPGKPRMKGILAMCRIWLDPCDTLMGQTLFSS